MGVGYSSAKHTPGVGEAPSPIPGTEKWKSSLMNLESEILNHGNSQKGLEGAVSKQRNQGQKHGSAGKFNLLSSLFLGPKRWKEGTDTSKIK